MLARTLISHLSETDYLLMEATSPKRHEYISGSIFEKTGESKAHNQIIVNLVGLFQPQLEATPYRVYKSDVKLKIAAKKSYYYPDVMLGCNNNVADEFIVSEPSLIIEVLSPTTAIIDKREKRVAYQSIPSLQEYCLVAQDNYYIEKYTRDPNQQGWFLNHYGEEDKINFIWLDHNIRVMDIYADIF